MIEKYFRQIFADYESKASVADWKGFEKKYETALKKAQFIKKVKYFSVAAAVVVTTAALLLFVTPEKAEIAQEPVVPKEELTVPAHLKHQEEQTVVKEAVAGIDKKVSTPPKATPVKKQDEPKGERRQDKTEMAVSADSYKTESPLPQKQKPVKEEIVEKEQTWEDFQKQYFGLNIDPSKLFVCAGEEIGFSPSVINYNYSYLWDFADGTYSQELFPKHTYESDGLYDVKLTVNTGSNDGSELTANYSMVVHSLPNADFDYEIKQQTFGYPQVTFFDKSDGSQQWRWDFGDGRFSYEQNPNHVYFINENSRYNVLLTVESAYGCSNKITKEIEFTDVFDLMAPNAFSPDGDGLNDYFLPKALEVIDFPFEMFIYDRAGNMVYKTKCQSKPWDGRIGTSGVIPDNGTFIWIVLLTDNTGETYKYAGTVSIIK